MTQFRLNKAQLGGCLLPLDHGTESMSHAGLPSWGQGRPRLGILPLPPPILRHRLQGTAWGGTAGEEQGSLWEDISRKLALPPCSDCSQGTCIATAKDTLAPAVSRTPGDPGVQVAFSSDLPGTNLESFGVSLGVNPGSATYWLSDLGRIT